MSEDDVLVVDESLDVDDVLVDDVLDVDASLVVDVLVVDVLVVDVLVVDEFGSLTSPSAPSPAGFVL